MYRSPLNPFYRGQNGAASALIEENRRMGARRAIDRAVGFGFQEAKGHELNVNGGVAIHLHGMPEVKRTQVSIEGSLFKKVALTRGTNLPVASWDG